MLFALCERKRFEVSNQLEEWKKELDECVSETGTSLEEVCEYLGLSYKNNIGFYIKLPKKRETYIGIGMAFKRPVEDINGWIKKYTGRPRLYSKDILSDMIWIYLINCNVSDDSDINYYRLYEECQVEVEKTYYSLWNEFVLTEKGTKDIDYDLIGLSHDDEYCGLKEYVAENMDSFKTAYSKPRKYLARYVDSILDTYYRAGITEAKSIKFLRGYLDDSMINYLVGDKETVNVIDMKSRDRTMSLKAIPKKKKTHISLCLALGMLKDEIDDYLELMGYAPLDVENSDEKQLIEMLDRWGKDHKLQEQYKKIYIYRETADKMTKNDERQAASDMLMLRSDLEYEYSDEGLTFPYMKE